MEAHQATNEEALVAARRPVPPSINQAPNDRGEEEVEEENDAINFVGSG